MNSAEETVALAKSVFLFASVTTILNGSRVWRGFPWCGVISSHPIYCVHISVRIAWNAGLTMISLLHTKDGPSLASIYFLRRLEGYHGISHGHIIMDGKEQRGFCWRAAIFVRTWNLHMRNYLAIVENIASALFFFTLFIDQCKRRIFTCWRNFVLVIQMQWRISQLKRISMRCTTILACCTRKWVYQMGQCSTTINCVALHVKLQYQLQLR